MDREKKKKKKKKKKNVSTFINKTLFTLSFVILIAVPSFDIYTSD